MPTNIVIFFWAKPTNIVINKTGGAKPLIVEGESIAYTWKNEYLFSFLQSSSMRKISSKSKYLKKKNCGNARLL